RAPAPRFRIAPVRRVGPTAGRRRATRAGGAPVHRSGTWGVLITPRKTKRPRRLVRAARNRSRHASGRHALARFRDHRAQLLAGLEHRHRTRGNFDWVAGARIARHTCLALPDLERPKPTNLNVMLLGERRFDGVQK